MLQYNNCTLLLVTPRSPCLNNLKLKVNCGWSILVVCYGDYNTSHRLIRYYYWRFSKQTFSGSCLFTKKNFCRSVCTFKTFSCCLHHEITDLGHNKVAASYTVSDRRS